MKFKTAIAGLSLLVVIFCTIQFSQGANSNANNIHFMAPPNEHPWQDSGSPLVRDTLQAETICTIPVVLGPFEIIVIKPVFEVKLNPSKTQTEHDRSYGRTPR